MKFVTGPMGGVRPFILATGEIFGGVERHVVTLVGELRRRGVDVAVALFHDASLAAELRNISLEPHILRTRSRLSLPLARELRRLLQSHDATALHVHGYRGAVHAAIAMYGLARREMSIVKTEHGLAETKGLSPIARALTLSYLLADIWGTRALRGTVAYVTQDLRARFDRLHYGLKQTVIYNGVSPWPTGTLKRPSAYAQGRKHVLVLGRLEAVKGIEFSIDALRHPGVGDDIDLHIVGDGPLAEILKQRAHDQNVVHRVFLHGFRRDAHRYLAHADALLMPSLHEGLPYTLLEAMSARVPIIASAVGGLKEILANDQTALLLPPRDAGAIAKALERLFSEPDLAARLVSNGATLCARQLSAVAMCDSYLDLYRRAGPRTPSIQSA